MAMRIYATSGLEDYDQHAPNGDFGGYHRGFDALTGQCVLNLSNGRAGEAIAVSPTGKHKITINVTPSPPI